MHEDGAGEASAKDGKHGWQFNCESINRLSDDDKEDKYERALNQKDKDCSSNGIVDLVKIQIEFFHGLPVEGLESHGVGIIAHLKLGITLFDFLEECLLFLLKLHDHLVFHLLF